MDTRMSVNERTRRSTVGMAVLLSIGVVVSSVMANKVAAAGRCSSRKAAPGRMAMLSHSTGSYVTSCSTENCS